MPGESLPYRKTTDFTTVPAVRQMHTLLRFPPRHLRKNRRGLRASLNPQARMTDFLTKRWIV